MTANYLIPLKEAHTMTNYIDESDLWLDFPTPENAAAYCAAVQAKYDPRVAAPRCCTERHVVIDHARGLGAELLGLAVRFGGEHRDGFDPKSFVARYR